MTIVVCKNSLACQPPTPITTQQAASQSKPTANRLRVEDGCDRRSTHTFPTPSPHHHFPSHRHSPHTSEGQEWWPEKSAKFLDCCRASPDIPPAVYNSLGYCS